MRLARQQVARACGRVRSRPLQPLPQDGRADADQGERRGAHHVGPRQVGQAGEEHEPEPEANGRRGDPGPEAAHRRRDQHRRREEQIGRLLRQARSEKQPNRERERHTGQREAVGERTLPDRESGFDEGTTACFAGNKIGVVHRQEFSPARATEASP